VFEELGGGDDHRRTGLNSQLNEASGTIERQVKSLRTLCHGCADGQERKGDTASATPATGA
jgi:hypothetical protein